MIRIIRGLEPLRFVGADIVEVAPAYDGVGEQTALVASQIAYEIITSWVGRGLADMQEADSTQEQTTKASSGKDEL